MAAKDFIQDSNKDILIRNNDLVIGESDGEHIEDIISSSQGSWKEFPLCGVGIDLYLNSSGTEQTLSKSITAQLNTDGFSNVEIVFTDKITVNAIRG